MLIAKAFNLTGIAGGYCSSLTSSLGTIAKAHKLINKGCPEKGATLIYYHLPD